MAEDPRIVDLIATHNREREILNVTLKNQQREIAVLRSQVKTFDRLKRNSVPWLLDVVDGFVNTHVERTQNSVMDALASDLPTDDLHYEEEREMSRDEIKEAIANNQNLITSCKRLQIVAREATNLLQEALDEL